MNTTPSQFAPFAEILREAYATPKPELKDGSAVAVYYSWQFGIGKLAGFALYNTTRAFGPYDGAGYTITEETLNHYGYSAPDMYASRSMDDNGENLCTA